MRSYIFNFSAKKVEELGVKGTPVIILDYLDRFFKSGSAEVKIQDEKNFYWITYSKIVNDNAFLDIKEKRVKQIIDELCAKNVLEKFDNQGEHYTKLYIRINYNKLLEINDGELREVIGQDKSLQFFMPGNINNFSNISYNSFTFIYEAPAIQNLLVSANKNTYLNLLKTALKMVLSNIVYDAFCKNFRLETRQNSIILHYKLTDMLIDANLYKIEQAVVQSYITLLISKNYPRKSINRPSAPAKVTNFQKSTMKKRAEGHEYTSEEINSLYTNINDVLI